MTTNITTSRGLREYMQANGVHMHRHTHKNGNVQWYFVTGARRPYNKKCATARDPVPENRACLYVKARHGAALAPNGTMTAKARAPTR